MGLLNNPFQFAGADGVITEAGGVDLMGARFYAPSLGRFITRDPSGISGGTNLYAYVGNDPVSLIDPTGRSAASQGEVSTTRVRSATAINRAGGLSTTAVDHSPPSTTDSAATGSRRR